MKIVTIVGARPQFIKAAPVSRALKAMSGVREVVVHTGQHYDLNMSDAFFEDLGLPDPDINLGVKSGTHAEQTGRVMMSYEKVLQEKRPDLVVVVGGRELRSNDSEQRERNQQRNPGPIEEKGEQG